MERSSTHHVSVYDEVLWRTNEYGASKICKLKLYPDLLFKVTTSWYSRWCFDMLELHKLSGIDCCRIWRLHNVHLMFAEHNNVTFTERLMLRKNLIMHNKLFFGSKFHSLSVWYNKMYKFNKTWWAFFWRAFYDWTCYSFSCRN